MAKRAIFTALNIAVQRNQYFGGTENTISEIGNQEFGLDIKVIGIAIKFNSNGFFLV